MGAWLQILATRNQDASKPLVGVEQVTKEHWELYGRNYYARYDYEGVDKPAAEGMMKEMAGKVGSISGSAFGDYKIKEADEFCYKDPVDGSVSANQGIRFLFDDGSRVVFRLSGTGVAGATIRLYLEKYVGPDGDLGQHQFEVCKPLATLALEMSKLKEFVDR